MIIGDKFVFLQLQKTASSHIEKILKHLFKARKEGGKHNTIENPLFLKKMIFGTIRNPYSWYVSLWSFGCENNGGIYRNLTRRRFRFIFEYIKSTDLHRIKEELLRPINEWRRLYSDVNNPKLFQEWLKLLFKRQEDVKEYWYKNLRQFGLYTYRYCILYLYNFIWYCDKSMDLYDLLVMDKHLNMLDYVIKVENLEKDLINVLDSIVVLDNRKKDYIKSMNKDKTNTTKHKHYTNYYNEKTINLIKEKERFLLDKYNYKFGE